MCFSPKLPASVRTCKAIDAHERHYAGETNVSDTDFLEESQAVKEELSGAVGRLAYSSHPEHRALVAFVEYATRRVSPKEVDVISEDPRPSSRRYHELLEAAIDSCSRLTP